MRKGGLLALSLWCATYYIDYILWTLLLSILNRHMESVILIKQTGKKYTDEVLDYLTVEALPNILYVSHLHRDDIVHDD